MHGERGLMMLCPTHCVIARPDPLHDPLHFEGVFGLRRAFALAGAQNLLMSLWAVEDETTVMQMTAFYRNLRTLPPAEALRQAQLETIAELREKYGQAAPILWAPFILQGGRALTHRLGRGRLPEKAVSMAD